MDVAEKELKAEFSSLGIKIDENQLTLCASMCQRNNISANDLVETWIAFALNHPTGDMLLTEENLLLMETKELTSSKTINNLYKSSAIEIPAVMDLAPITPAKPAVNGFSPGYEAMEVTPSKIENTLITPNKVAPSDKLNSSQNNYIFPPQIIHTYGSEVKEDTEESSVNIICSVMPDVEKDCCMYSTIKDEALLLSDATFQLIETIKSNYNFSEDENEDSGSYYSGRIMQSQDSKLNPQSIKLHNPDLGDFTVDISQLNEYSVFPGQVIVVKGIRSGNKIIASHIYDSARLPLPSEPISITGKIKLLVACGPFIESENDSLDSMDYIAKCAQHLQPQAVIILGPIINSKSFSSDRLHDFQSLYKKAVDCLSSQIDKKIKIYCVINKTDRCSIPVYPTLPPTDMNSVVNFLPDPAFISVNGVSIALSSSDVLLHIAKHEIRKNRGERFLQLCDHCIKQQSMYPLYPADISIGMDYKLWDRYAVFTHSPHFLFCRSAFKYFVKESDGKNVLINSGSMSSRKDTRTFALLELFSADSTHWDPATSCCVKILKT